MTSRAAFAIVLTLGAATPGAAEERTPLEIWNDPAFREQVVGGLASSSDFEPGLSAVEREELSGILPLVTTDPARAIAELEVLTTPEASAKLDMTLATLYFQEGRLDDAKGYYAAAVRKFPAYRNAHRNLGLLRVRTGDFPGALVSLGRVLELGGGDGLTYGLLGYAYGALERWVPAESAYRDAVLLQPDQLDWKLGLTQAVFKQQKYAEAVKLCDDLIARYPDRHDFLLLQANALIGLGLPTKAAQNFEIVRRMGKASPGSLQTLGDIYVNESLYELAASAYAETLAGEPKPSAAQAMRNVEVLAQRGALAEAKGLLHRVREAYSGALGSDENRKALKLEARIAVAEGSGDEAAQVLEQIVEVDPLDGEALILLGQHHAKAGNADRAIFYYEWAASLEAYEADAKVRLAQLFVGQARYGEAVPLLKRAQEIRPRDDVARYLDQVERLARSRR